MSAQAKTCVIGAGAFGTALAVVASEAGCRVSLWTRDSDHAEAMIRSRTNDAHLPGIALPEGISITTVPASAAAGVDCFLCAVPAQATAAVLSGFSNHVAPQAFVVACAKGLEQSTGRRQSEIIAQSLPWANPAVLSGPGFAGEIARRLPTAVSVAAADPAVSAQICQRLATEWFRPYAGGDLVGVELGGALKNVLAIACGVVVGRKLGEGARAALIARGLAEMIRFGTELGARAETFSGLSGLGDLVLTASSRQSRNLSFGIQLGEGADVSRILGPGAPLVEGAYTASIVSQIARQRNIDMPIADCVADTLDRRLTIDQAINRLMQRPLTREWP